MKSIYEASDEVKQLIEQLDYFLFEYEKPIVISLQGYWGIGKTYFWHEYIKNKNKDKTFVYISLFGVNSLEDIKRKIILKASNRAKISDKLQKTIGTSKIAGFDLSSLISILDKDDFKDIIICFDDFERISESLSMSDVLGFTSELKEQNECRIVMINNNEILREQDELYHQKIIKSSKEKKANTEENKVKYFITSTNNFEIYEKFSEKVIDLNLRYEPSIDDLVNIVKNENNKYINFDFIVKLFNALKDRDKKFNLRLINQLVLKLEVVKDILQDTNILESYKQGLIYEIFILTVKENLSKNNFDLTNIKSVFSRSELAILIEKHRFNVEKVQDHLVNLSNELTTDEAIKDHHEKIKTEYDKYLFDMNYNNKEFAKKFFPLLDDDKFEKPYIDLFWINEYIQLLIKVNGNDKEKYEAFFLQKVENYILNKGGVVGSYMSFPDRIFGFLNEEFISWLDKDGYLREYIEKLEKKNIAVKLDGILELIQNIMKKQSWNEGEETLNAISSSKHKKQLIENQEYFKVIFDFMKWTQKFSGNKPFQDFYEKTMAIYKELEKDDKYAYKVERILGRLGEEV